MSLENNPLKQYFRRPAIYLKLPSLGKLYSSDVVDLPENGELPVYPMTAIDEISARTPDALFNGVAMVDIMKSCVPNIKNPWAINSIDLDAILIAIRAASGDSNLTITSECPSCKEIAEYSLNLISVLSQLKAGNYDTELVINDLTIKFKPLTYKQMTESSLSQVEIQRTLAILQSQDDDIVKTEKMQEALKHITEVTMQILSKTVAYIKTPNAFVDNTEYILDFLRNSDKNNYALIRDHNATLKEASSLKPLEIKCVHCQHQYEQNYTLDTSNFFG
jgi:phage FluMu protein Com